MSSFIPNVPISEEITTSASIQQANGSARVMQSPVRKQIIAIRPKVKRKVAELKNAEVRWFYRRKDEAKWVAFKGYDSTILEIAYRKTKNMELDEATKQIFNTFPERVILMDGNFVADEALENINAIYWKEDSYQIRRGTWFYASDMQPLPADFSDAIEGHHLKCFKDNVIPETPVFSESESSKKPELTTIKWEDEKVCWNSVVDVHIAPQKSNLVVRFLTRSRGPIPLRRSFTEETDPSEGRPNFSDLILVIHGIGQKGYENLIAKNTAQIRDALLKQMEKNYPNEKRRPAILPIEWRSSLQLDNGLTDVVTLPKMPDARNVLNSVCMDLMYYQSPLYRTEIVNGVIKCLNGVYSTFMDNNPGFSGPISIVGHSLGSVIAYDILTNWSPFLLYDQFVTNAIAENIEACSSVEQKRLLEQFYNSKKEMLALDNTMEQILIRQEEPLKFKVKYLFCLGSPLAIFCIMRGADYKTVIPRPDQVERIFNIFHPYDPVAYRIEPMFHENYKHIRPLKLFHHQSAMKSYENAIFECHRSYLHKCKTPGKKDKEGGKSKKSKKGNGGKSEENNGKNGKSNKGKDGEGQQQQPKPITDEEDEQQHFMDDTDSDLEIASSTYTTGDGSTPRSVTPQQITESVGLTASAAPPRPETPSTAKATTSTPFPPLTVENLESRQKIKETQKNDDELPPPEQGIEVAEEEGTVEDEALPAGDDGQLKMSPLDDLKKMGEAGKLVEQIPPERRISQRIDFQVQPWVLDKSYWSMLKSHFSYWANLDVAAFLLNAIYPPPLEVTGVVKTA